uniref:Putative secreted protein n=1 Tax=Ixodes ricinus TaxID=34613 RepID=A0A6B0TYY7_IXORI
MSTRNSLCVCLLILEGVNNAGDHIPIVSLEKKTKRRAGRVPSISLSLLSQSDCGITKSERPKSQSQSKKRMKVKSPAPCVS